MNIQRIFEALEEDSQNSALGIICTELEAQGYTVQMNDIPVNSERFFEGDFTDIEKDNNPVNVKIFREAKFEQTFSIEFIDFHEIAIKK